MKQGIIEILRANTEDGQIRRRDVASFVLLLVAPLFLVAGVVAGAGAVQQVMTLLGALTLAVSTRLVVKPTGVARAVYLVGVVLTALTAVAGFVPSLNNGSIALESACTALLITSAALFAARPKNGAQAGPAAPSPSAG